MASFVLIPGAGGSAWYWSRVVPLLQDAGHDVVAVDLPGDDPHAGLPEYAEIVVQTIGQRENVHLVAQSLGGFTAAMVCAQAPIASLVLVNAMIPQPGEKPGAWWTNTGAIRARESAAEHGGWGPFNLVGYFLHDVPPEVVADGEAQQRAEAEAVFGSACEFDSWPPVPIRVLSGAEDRFLPVGFQQALAQERLGIEPDVLPGGHLIALAQPEAVARYLLMN